jgi:NAD(P)H-dependent flavin oxidoreductase YrpB (nitropropane dioxygenase family)
MLHTFLTTSWQLRYPIIGAPMAYVGRGRLARAVSQAGGLGMIGIGSKETAELIAREAAIARGDDQGRFGIELMAWVLEQCPELFHAAIQAHPVLISISFGSPAPYVEMLHREGIYLAAQETETVLTRAFDVAQGIPWPTEYPGRALRNRFTEQWHHQTEALTRDEGARQQLAEAIKNNNYDLAHIYAGEGVGLVKREQPAAEVIRQLGDGAEELLRDRCSKLLD